MHNFTGINIVLVFLSISFSYYVPKLWKRDTITSKVGKEDTTHPKSSLPINLRSFVLKPMKKVVDNYISIEILERVPLYHSQHKDRQKLPAKLTKFRMH